ncbi:MAG: hypothetical protein EDQ89_10530 [Acidobacteria bacterium]|nr:MAG: hypothetical protein EDQ89_10530 [Acidobacteriota bacterium]MCL4286872.1 hypothetical protein [Thermoleophilia bacterium]
MLEERERAHRERLAERSAPLIPSGERIVATAVCQAGVPPWLGVVPLLAGLVLVVVSLLAGAGPGWLGPAGALLVLAAIAAMGLARRRLVVRTNRSVRVFALPRSDKAELGAPLAELPLSDLPGHEGGSTRLGGERLWPNYGSGIERDALARALARPERTPGAAPPDS